MFEDLHVMMVISDRV